MVKRFYIGGMTCANCQNRIESKLRSLPGVKEVRVSFRNGTAQIDFDEKKISFTRIEREIDKLGYKVLNEGKAGRKNIVRAIGLLAAIIVLYVILQQFGILNLLVPSQLADSSMGYSMLFVIGLLTSIHCIAMCGGINLSQCLPKTAVGESEKKGAAFLPSVLYNLGRVVSYTLVGFLLGLIGWLVGGSSGVGVPVLLQGIMKLVAGVLMIVMGINMLGIFPWLRRLNIQMPGSLSKRIGQKKATAVRPFAVGFLNGLMPCGPLQSMQILALASANPFIGALSMLLFSLGTVPLMLGLGSIVTVLGKRFTSAVMNVGAVLVTVLGFAMLSQGGSLTGWLSSEILLFLIIGLSVIGIASMIPFAKKTYRAISVITAVVLVLSAGIVLTRSKQDTHPTDANAQIVDGVQNVNSTLLPGQYPTITVQAGIPVKWTIDAPTGSINGCNYKMIIQKYGIEHVFQEDKNVIEFTPTEAGTLTYTCWMGMIKGKIIVTESAVADSTPSDTSDESSKDDSGNDGNAQVISEGEYLTIPVSQINETATFYPITVDGTPMEVLAIKASDGTVRTAFNTCQMCYTSGKGYYIQEGTYLICQNCGSRFTADEVEIRTGGCNPWPISDTDKKVTADSVCISYDFLKEYIEVFAYWKK